MPSVKSLYRFSLLVVVLLTIVSLPMTAVVSAHPTANDPGAKAVLAPTPVSVDSPADDSRVDATDVADDGAPGAVVGDPGTTAEPVNAGNLDGDVLDDGTEARLGFDPMTADTDGDGLSDEAEVRHGTDPTRSDTDGDGLSDRLETQKATDPLTVDSDGDGIDDSTELKGLTNPTVADTDGDGLSDGDEPVQGTDPTRPDTDGDGLTDGAEVNTAGTDPLAADSDGDFLEDANELRWGADPTDWADPSSIPGFVGGFIIGAMLSAGVMIQGARIRQYLEALPFVGRAIRNPAAVAGERDTDSDERADGTSPAVEETETRMVTDDEIIPDDVYIQKILGEKNGRAKQSNIVEMTEWSKSKVSRVLSRMAEEGEVIKIMLGRENLVCLPGYEPEIAKSSLG